MHLDPLPGTDRRTLITTLGEVVADLKSRIHQPTAAQKVWAYLDWTNRAVERLRDLLRPAAIEALVFTPNYRMIMAGLPNREDVVSHLLVLEMEQRVKVLDSALAGLKDQKDRWSIRAMFVALDTGVYIHGDKIREIDFHAVIEPTDQYTQLVADGPDVHLLIPIAVIDQLDGLKDRGPGDTVRWRAAHTLGVIDELFRRPRDQVLLSTAHEGRWKGAEVRAEILFDSPGHVPLPHADSEIIARVASAVPMAARPITLVTFDTGMSLRAREAGVPCIKLQHPRQSEPEPTPRGPKLPRGRRPQAPVQDPSS